MRYLPRCYNDLFIPEDENGAKLNHDQSHEGYTQYIRWLSEYLYKKDISFSDRQSIIVDICNADKPLHAAIWFSDLCGYYLWERDRLEGHIRNNTQYDVLVKEEYEFWFESLTDDPYVDEPFEDVVTTLEEYESIRFDMKLQEKIKNCPDELDIPYRGVLKTIIMRCSSEKERIEAIEIFYDNFNETASK